MLSPILYPAAAALAAVLVLVPLPAQRRSCNIALVAGMVCMFLSSFIYFVNTLVWAKNVRDVSPIWCDITTNFVMYSQYSLEFSALCICKHLAWISSPYGAVSKRRNRTIFEITCCCVLPLISIPIRYALSTNRYMILEGWGCLPAIYPSEMSAAIIFGPQVGICFQAFLFACFAVRNFIRRRTLLGPNTFNSGLTKPRFIRLLVLCPFMGIWPGAAVLLIIYFNFSLKLSSLPGWTAIHRFFPKVLTMPAIVQSPAVQRMALAIYWVYITNAYIFAIILATGEDVRSDYFKAWVILTHKIPCCHRPRQKTSPTSSAWFSSTSLDSLGHGLDQLSTSASDSRHAAPSVPVH